MEASAGLLIYIYFGMIFVSRVLFKHRELVRAAGPGIKGQSGPEKRRGACFCLLPLALMQITPLVEYWIRYWPIRDDAGAKDLFAVSPIGNAAAGVILFVAGTLVAARASRQLARAWREAPGALYVAGLYSVIRHPLYAAYLLQGAGCMMMLGSRWTWIAYVLAAALVLVRVFQEDRELASQYPAFEAYSSRVKRLMPGIF